MKFTAQVVALMYRGISREKCENHLYWLWKVCEKDLSLRTMVKSVMKQSCVGEHMRKVIRCPQCKHWVNTNHVYCPLCVSNSSSTIEDWEKCRLVMCKRKACPANPAYRCTDLSDAQTACCCHLSKKILGEFVLYMSPECIIADRLCHSRILQITISKGYVWPGRRRSDTACSRCRDIWISPLVIIGECL